MAARTWSRSRPRRSPDELTPPTTAPCVTIEGIREKLRVLLVSGEPHAGRAHVAQPAEVRRQRRSRPLHHPAPAREAGRHADQRVVADRLPDARAVPAEDQGVRPHHLRPLRQPERPALDLFREHRPLRARRRRPAGGGGPGIRRRAEPGPHAPLADHPRPPRRAHVEEPYKARITDGRPAPSRHPRPAGFGREPARAGASGCASSARRSAPARP